MERKIKLIFIFFFLNYMIFPVNLIMRATQNELVSITVVSPCGRADEGISGLLSVLFLYQREKWRKSLWNSGGRVEAKINEDSSYFRVIALKNYWNVATNVTESLIFDSQINPISLETAKKILVMSLPRPTLEDFGPFLFYPMSEYGHPFPVIADIMKINSSHLKALKNKCFSSSRVRVIVEGGFVPSIVKNIYMKKNADYPPPPRLVEPPDRPPIGVGFLPDDEYHVIWFFKLIEEREILPIKYLIHSLAMNSEGLLYTMFSGKIRVNSGIKYGRNVSFGWIDLKVNDPKDLREVFFVSRRVIYGKLRTGIEEEEYNRARKYELGREKYYKSLPWPIFRREWKAIRMREKKMSIEQMNNVLKNFPLRSTSVLITGRENNIKEILDRVSSIGVFDSLGRFMYELSSE